MTWSKAECHSLRRLVRSLPSLVQYPSDPIGIARGVVSIHEIASGAERLRLEPPVRRPFSSLRFSGDGSRLAVASVSNRVLLWDLARLRRELEALQLDRW